MTASISVGMTNDDPRKLRNQIARVAELAQEHSISSVLVGFAAPEGDRLFPELIDYLQSALRVEDGIFRMTRERAMVQLTDVDRSRATEVIDRIVAEFMDEYPAMSDPTFEVRYFEVKPGIDDLSVKRVLTEIFTQRLLH